MKLSINFYEKMLAQYENEIATLESRYRVAILISYILIVVLLVIFYRFM